MSDWIGAIDRLTNHRPLQFVIEHQAKEGEKKHQIEREKYRNKAICSTLKIQSDTNRLKIDN